MAVSCSSSSTVWSQQPTALQCVRSVVWAGQSFHKTDFMCCGTAPIVLQKWANGSVLSTLEEGDSKHFHLNDSWWVYWRHNLVVSFGKPAQVNSVKLKGALSIPKDFYIWCYITASPAHLHGQCNMLQLSYMWHISTRTPRCQSERDHKEGLSNPYQDELTGNKSEKALAGQAGGSIHGTYLNSFLSSIPPSPSISPPSLPPPSSLPLHATSLCTPAISF